MSILSLLNQFIKRYFDDCFQSMSLHDLVKHIEDITNDLALELITHAIEQLDQAFFESSYRKQHFLSHKIVFRTLMTSLGTITFPMRCYKVKNKDRAKGKAYYCYLRESLDIDKYARLSHDAVLNILKMATEVNGVYASKHALKNTVISRQTVTKCIQKAVFKEDDFKPTTNTPSTLYIEIDEHYVKRQNKSEKRASMVKMALIHEGYDESLYASKRKALKHKQYIACVNQSAESFFESIYDYVYQRYDFDQIKHIFISSDGASWIESNVSLFPRATSVLDPFHYHKALRTLFKNQDDYRHEANTALKDGNTDVFTELCQHMIDAYPTQVLTLRKTQIYLLNQMKRIQNQDHEAYQVKCSMEGHISHVLAARLTSRPKAYAKKTIEPLVQLCVMRANENSLEDRLMTKQEVKFSIVLRKELKRQIRFEKHRIIKAINHDDFYKDNQMHIPTFYEQPTATSHLIKKLID